MIEKKELIKKTKKKEKDTPIPITNSDYTESGIVNSSGKVGKKEDE